MPDGRVGKSMPLAEFFRRALLNQVRAVVRGEIARGRDVPVNVAHIIGGA